MKKLISALFAAFAVFSAPAFAQDSGLYVSVGTGSSQMKMANSSTGSIGKNASTVDLAFGGYVTDNLIIEGTYTDMGTRALQVANIGTGSASTASYGIHAIFMQPVGNGLSVFVRAGLLHTEINTGVNKFGAKRPTFGLGVEYDLAPRFSVNASYNLTNRFGDAIPQIDARYIRFGVKYFF